MNEEENVEKEDLYVQPEEVDEKVMTEESEIEIEEIQKMLKKFLLEMQKHLGSSTWTQENGTRINLVRIHHNHI